MDDQETTKKFKSPRGVSAWLKQVQNTPLPILKTSVRNLNNQIKAGDALADLALTIERDPALCLHLALEANRVSHEENPDLESDILSLNHVLTILGMQGIVRVIRSIPTIKLNTRSTYEKAYLQAQSNSLFAAHLCEEWAQKAHAGSSEKMKWSALLAGAPYWAMWRGAYEQMRMLEWYRYKQHIGRRKAEANLFGCYLDDITRMLGRHFKLPNLSQQSLEGQALPTLKHWAKILSPKHEEYFDQTELRRLRHKPAVVMVIAKSIANSCALGWYQRHNLRCQRALANMFGEPLDKVSRDMHQLALAFSQQFSAPYVILPAQSLIWPVTNTPELKMPYRCIFDSASDQSVPEQIGTPSLPKKAEQKPEPPRQPNKKILLHLIDQFRERVHEFKDVHDILITCNKAITQGLGMRQAVIFVPNKGLESLRPVYCVGIDEASPIQQLRIVLAQNRFFYKLTEKTACMKIDKTNFDKVKKMLSQSVLEVLSNQNFMVMSLFANNKVIGVVYADTKGNEENISDAEYLAFKQICQATSFALEQYSQRRKASSSAG